MTATITGIKTTSSPIDVHITWATMIAMNPRLWLFEVQQPKVPLYIFIELKIEEIP